MAQSITNLYVAANGQLVAEYDNGIVDDLPIFVGVPGTDGADGAPGADGSDGLDGLDGAPGATGPKGDTGAQGAKGDRGDTGNTGQRGATGASLTILGTLQDLTALPTTAIVGNAYRVDDDLHVWNGNVWINVGNIIGPKGDTGAVGPTGPQGQTGATGKTGANVNLRGPLDNPSMLPASGSVGDVFVVAGSLYAWHSNDPAMPSEPAPGDPNEYLIVPDVFQTERNTAIELGLTGNDHIPAGAQYAYYIYRSPQQGSVAWNGSRYVYTPNADFVGTDTLSYGVHPENAPVANPDGTQVTIHVVETAGGEWANLGSLVGPQGVKGDTGATGSAGIIVGASEPESPSINQLWVRI